MERTRQGTAKRAARPETQEAFIQFAAHELRTPLTVLYGMLQLLAGKQQLNDPSCRRLLNAAIGEAQRMQAIIGDLTDVTRLRSGQAGLDLRVVDLATLAADAVAQARASRPDQAVRLRACKGTLQVRVDRARMQHALQHLLAHVITHSPSHGAIDVRLGRENAWAFVVLEGHGPSVRAPRTVAAADGPQSAPAGGGSLSGFHVYIAEQLIAPHGGRVVMHGQPDVVMTVRVELPLVISAER
jgi:signal transduction histidine kinase